MGSEEENVFVMEFLRHGPLVYLLRSCVIDKRRVNVLVCMN
jgi:hypothetical protein